MQMQNAAATLLTNTPRRSHITPVLAALHWLPVDSRIVFNLITYKSLNGLPLYIAEVLHPKVNSRQLSSSDKGRLLSGEQKLIEPSHLLLLPCGMNYLST